MKQILAALADRAWKLLMNRDAFGFRTVGRDWDLGPRRLDDHLLYLVVAQSHEAEIQGQRIAVNAGDLLWLAPRTPHHFRLPRGGEPITLYHVRFRLLRGARDVAHNRWRSVEDASVLRPHFQDIVDELQTDLPAGEQRIRALLQLVFIELQRRQVSAAPSGALLNALQRQRLHTFFRENAAARPTPAALAAELRLSPDYFARIFRRTYGVSPRRWLMRQRLQHAAQRLLESQLNVTELARELGYADLFLFSRQFKQVLGCSPRAYRQRHAPVQF